MHSLAPESDLTTFTGSLTYDQTTESFTAGSITDNSRLIIFSICFGPETYVGPGSFLITVPRGCTADCDQFRFGFYRQGNPASLPYLDLYFSGDPSAFSGGAIEPIEAYVGFFGPATPDSSNLGRVTGL